MVTMRRPCFCGEALEIRHARHRAVVVHDLADDARGREPGEAREIDRALGLPGAHEHAAAARARAGRRGPGVTRSSGCASGRDGDADRVRAIGGADARS